MKNITLKEALTVLLHDQDGSLNSSCKDEVFTEVIVEVLSDSGICPFKQYKCKEACSDKCSSGVEFDCSKDPKEIWVKFISSNEYNMSGEGEQCG